jgi:aldose sugar dehydrogenase
MKKIILLASGLIIFLTGLSVYRYLHPPKSPRLKTLPQVQQHTPPVSVPHQVQEVAQGLNVPWSLVFTSKDRLLVSERSGSIREIIQGTLKRDPLYTFSAVSSKAEEGLMGLAVDPDYEQNRYLYAAVAYPVSNKLQVQIVRLIDDTTSIRTDRVILDTIPAARFHAGTRLAFGPDKKLYITTGDATDKNIAQNLQSLGGKILRINTDGSIPDDNPFGNSPVFALGLRNSQGIDWDSTGRLFSVDHGPSTFDGPPGGDELNYIIPGGNYGWPIVSHEQTRKDFVSPLLVFTPAVAPASTLVYSGTVFPQYTENVFFGGLRGTGIYRVIIDPVTTQAVSYEKLNDIQVGRIRDIIEGPDGLIYFSTSNTDGRGTPNTGDDKIYKLVPKQP